MDGATLTGVSGQILWGYFVAARVTGYAVTRTGAGDSARWTVRATLADANAFNLRQRPLIFVAPHNRGDWRWPMVSPEINDGILTAQLGILIAAPSAGGSVTVPTGKLYGWNPKVVIPGSSAWRPTQRAVPLGGNQWSTLSKRRSNDSP